MRSNTLTTNIQLARVLKKVLLLLVIFCFSGGAIGQKGTSYFIYKVRKGESFRSIAAKYNIVPSSLADYNNLDFYEGDLTAKTLRIPARSIKKPTQEPVPVKQPADSTPITSKEIITSEPVPIVPQTSTAKDTVTTPDTVVVVSNSNSNQFTAVNEETPTIQSDVQKHLPLLIFLGVGILLLIIAIVYYRAVHRK